MAELKSLKNRQRQLLRDWLDTADGGKRFGILKELREVEQQLTLQASQLAKRGKRVHTFAVR
ncbi:MAG: hypothetical protein OWT28_07300 [Firmicutes bacterium]|nr:hypothetical protein [Bacillota bacterium]